MALRPRAVIKGPYPSPAATARLFGVSRKHYRELQAWVTEVLKRERHQHARTRRVARRSAAHRAG